MGRWEYAVVSLLLDQSKPVPLDVIVGDQKTLGGSLVGVDLVFSDGVEELYHFRLHKLVDGHSLAQDGLPDTEILLFVWHSLSPAVNLCVD